MFSSSSHGVGFKYSRFGLHIRDWSAINGCGRSGFLRHRGPDKPKKPYIGQFLNPNRKDSDARTISANSEYIVKYSEERLFANLLKFAVWNSCRDWFF
jgi:hypothetical protein